MAERVTTERVAGIAHYLDAYHEPTLDKIATEVVALARHRDELEWSLKAAMRRIETLQGMLDK